MKEDKHDQEPGKAPAKSKVTKKGCLLLLVLFVSLVVIVRACSDDGPAKTPNEKKIDAMFSVLDGSHNGLVEATKATMNDASSFEHVETSYIVNPDTTRLTLFMTYRGNNAFGSKVIAKVRAISDMNGNVLSIEAL
jgi:hypothetical protein